ncbi:hypothetical protein PALU110988_11965 [Paenibacillus lupini]|uniref:hypothetical protein n=1 Tax=Paenibacillus lupini TaxID=1450204 RepID=UPI00141EAB43|nr:hypothetical protein [Paenibacillus lupini]NIK21358.1 hypothetical protein [Paenibacillus lupini]
MEAFASRKLILLIGISIIVILSAGLYIRQQYVFNPISFKKDDVVIHDWSDYRYPLVMEISNVDEGWTSTSISNRKDIKFVYNELRSAKMLSANTDDTSSGTHFAITIKSSGSKGHILDQFDGYMDGITRINNGKKIEVTKELRKYIEDSFNSNETVMKDISRKLSVEEAEKLIAASQNIAQSSDKNAEIKEITSADTWDKTKVQLFRIAEETFIIKNQKVIHIGNGFGGNGVTSAVPYDVNKDGITDIIYAYSFGSGMHRSMISWIDLKSFEEHMVGDKPKKTEFRMYDLILKNEKDTTVVYRVMNPSEINTYPTEQEISQMSLQRDGILIWENNELYNKQDIKE